MMLSQLSGVETVDTLQHGASRVAAADPRPIKVMPREEANDEYVNLALNQDRT